MARLFIAVRTPQTLVKELTALQYRLSAELRALRPAPNLKPERLLNSHCTLRFLGEVEESRIETMITAVRDEIKFSKIAPFEASLTRCGVFNSHGKVRVLWIGLAPEAVFQRLQKTIDAGLRAAGILPGTERAFHPHLTLFRFREPYNLPGEFALPKLTSCPTALIHEVILVESKTLPAGSVHTVLATFPF